jgi:hypothetical protein
MSTNVYKMSKIRALQHDFLSFFEPPCCKCGQMSTQNVDICRHRQRTNNLIGRFGINQISDGTLAGGDGRAAAKTIEPEMIKALRSVGYTFTAPVD